MCANDAVFGDFREKNLVEKYLKSLEITCLFFTFSFINAWGFGQCCAGAILATRFFLTFSPPSVGR
jgi:hypothetical protein